MKINRDKVIEACRKELKSIEETRRAIFEKEAEAVYNGFLNRFRKWDMKRCREYVIDRDNGLESIGHVISWKVNGWGSQFSAEQLLFACSVSDDEFVDLSTDDAAKVGKWLKNE